MRAVGGCGGRNGRTVRGHAAGDQMGGWSGDWVGAPEGAEDGFSRPQSPARPPGLMEPELPFATNDAIERGRWERGPHGASRGRVGGRNGRTVRGHAGGGNQMGGGREIGWARWRERRTARFMAGRRLGRGHLAL